MHIRTTIGSLGYSPREVTVYLAALELGESTVTEIAKRARMPRITANACIKSLHQKGMINAYLMNRRKLWAAESPDRLLSQLKERENALRTVLPKLQVIQHSSQTKNSVRIYNGAEEIKQIVKDMFEKKHNIQAIVPWLEWVDLVGGPFINDFTEARVERSLRIQLLTTKQKWTMALREKDPQEMRNTRFFPASLPLKNIIFLYDDSVAIISPQAARPIGILIEDEDMRNSMGVLFDTLWHQSKD